MPPNVPEVWCAASPIASEAYLQADPCQQQFLVRKGFFSPGESKAVVSELPDPLEPVVRFAALTGWRKGEMLRLRWSDVDFHSGEVRLWASKNDEPCVFPFRVLRPLERLPQEQRDLTRAIEKKTGEDRSARLPPGRVSDQVDARCLERSV